MGQHTCRTRNSAHTKTTDLLCHLEKNLFLLDLEIVCIPQAHNIIELQPTLQLLHRTWVNAHVERVLCIDYACFTRFMQKIMQIEKLELSHVAHITVKASDWPSCSLDIRLIGPVGDEFHTKL